jgi:thiamine-monophosphate kinase
MRMIELVERAHLLNWMHKAERSPHQVNSLFASDCELLKLDDQTLALTTDTISEEIGIGLYKDPYTCGFIAATASLSDLAAVGAIPLGLLFAACFARGASDEFRGAVSRGFCHAAQAGQTHVIGGDSSVGAQTVLTSTGVGTCERPLTRIGAQKGDLLVLSGKCGIGPALAYQLLLGIEEDPDLEAAYRPQLCPQTRSLFAAHARAMIDTSDGILSAVTTLCALNGVGARLFWNEHVLEGKALRFCDEKSVPQWALWVAEHGDYQLLAIVPKESASRLDDRGHVIGEIADPGIFDIEMNGAIKKIDASWAQLVAQTPAHEFGRRCKSLLDEFRTLGFS